MATTKTTAAKSAAPKTTATKTAAVKPSLTVNVKLYDVKADELYLIGNIAGFGAWDASKAKKMTKKGDVFTANVPVKAGELVEFKVSAAPCWSKVEKGIFGEELANHAIVIDSDKKVVEVGVSNFAE